MLMALVAFDVIADGLISADMKSCLVEYMVGGLIVLLPSMCLVISILLYAGLLVEI